MNHNHLFKVPVPLIAGVVWMALQASLAADPRAQLWTEHSDLRVVYRSLDPNPLALVARDEDHRVAYEPSKVVLNVAADSRIELPPGTPFGEAGSSLWILPQSQDPSLLYLGFSAEQLPRDVFTAPLRFQLTAVRGPGGFAAWQAAAFGQLDVKFNSLDGISNSDRTTPIIGSHEHFNWGFTAPGVYAVTFQVEGEAVGVAGTLRSDPSTFVFHVHPLPSPTTYAVFAEQSWHPNTVAAEGAADADPDGDGLSNLWEYLSGSDPCNSESVSPLQLRMEQTDIGRDSIVRFTEREGVQDYVLQLERATDLVGPWESVEKGDPVSVESGVKTWEWRERVEQGSRSFFRLNARPLALAIRLSR